ncbi:MAG: hypothetical protein Q7U10_11925 [Thermodesulfovibrionia bacterium]|nr:hypothetical protein [Thermodesulfovibrionia bacterium]
MKKQILRLTIFIIFAFVFINCTSTSSYLPETINIIPPSKDLPSEIAALSGKWKGTLSIGSEIILVVEQIDNAVANIIVSRIDPNSGNSMYQYHEAAILSGPIMIYRDTYETCTVSIKNELNKLSISCKDETVNSRTEGELIRVIN